MGKKDSHTKVLFETSWEVCNKIGGIYTVLSTKAKELGAEFGDNLIFIGPDVWSESNPSPSFIEGKIDMINPEMPELPYGIKVRTGRWNVPGKPVAVLVRFEGVYQELDRYYGLMWEAFGVDSLPAYGDYGEGCAFAIASSLVIKAITQQLKTDARDVYAHFDEWTTAMGLLNLQLILPESCTLFTTHATSIGRSICGNGKPLYDYFEGYNGPQMAAELNMVSKNSLETAAAIHADCFTTVSDVTARECVQLLGVRPQVVTPNGFEFGFVPSVQKATSLRKKGRKAIFEIVSALTGQEYTDDTVIVATSGRNEYRNKGLDLFVDSVETLNSYLKGDRKVIALVLVPGWVKEPSKALLDNLANGNKGDIYPDFSSHRLNNEDCDPLFGRISLCSNRQRNGNVSLVLLPCYLDGHDGVLNIDYYDLMPALDITVFPSYYEPWGYTPLESVAFGVPTITTDKSGFGQWVKTNFNTGLLNCGVDVVVRNDSDYQESCRAIAADLYEFCKFSKSRIAQVKKSAKATASKADWKEFIKYYNEAFSVAAERRDKRCDE